MKNSPQKIWNLLFQCLAVFLFFSVFYTLGFLLWDLWVSGSTSLSWDFLTSFPSRRAAKAGIFSAWVGSLYVIFVTAFCSIPLGVMTGVYLEEYAPKNKMTLFLELMMSNLAGVPSIVYGLLALGIFVQYWQLGQSILTAGLTLSLLILPMIVISTRESLRLIPQSIREAAYALGATRWELVKDHLLPYSWGGILTGIILGLSRAIGETAPLLTIGALTFVAFLPSSPIQDQIPYLSFDWLWDSFTVLPIQMFNWISRPQEDFHKKAAAAGLVLMMMTCSMNALAMMVRHYYRKRIKW